MLHLTRLLLLFTFMAVLTACGDGGGSSSSGSTSTNQETGNTDTGSGDTGGGDTDGSDTDSGDTDGGDTGGGDEDDTVPPVTEEEEAQLLTLIDTNNHFTVSVCPQALLGTQLGGAIDVLTCENEALENISLGNDNLLGLLCADTVAATESNLLSSATNPDFLQNCLLESGAYLKDTLTGLLDNSGPIGQQLCPSSTNPIECIIETVNTVPDSTLIGVLGYLGCEDSLNPQVCLSQVAENLSKGEPLISTVNSLSTALCPISTRADNFQPQACLTEVLGGVGSILNLSGGLGELCPEDADPLTCLLAAGEKLGPVGDLLGGGTINPGILTDLLAGLAEPGNLALLETLPTLLEQIPVLGDLLAGLLNNGGDLFAPLKDLQTLPELLTQLPILGDLLNGIAGGDSGGLPTDALDLESLLNGLSGDQLTVVTDLLAEIPVLGNVIDQLLGAVACESGSPLDCLTQSAGQLGQFGDLLTEVPLLGDLLEPLLATLTGVASGGELLAGVDLLNEVPVVGDLLNQILTVLQGGAGDSLLTPDLAMLIEQPALQGLLDSLLGGLVGGLAGGDPSQLLNGILDQDGNLLDAVIGLVQSLPIVGDLVGSLLVSLLGENAAGSLLAPLSDVLADIPVLGPVLGGLLGGLLG
ncbi:hypothetical protein Y017_06980 [Alcanivorax sp. 97CO-5]|uniref:hypothetical protein n=1 Tax=unclassified Alcanivorax TaxID=2638842 RepID=UPI0003E7E5F6|nr:MULTISPECIES: hypothetical protein [unclassified Alcanivorax]EUC70732.1 hypothetical protein Y017_06980 [Alcanivorax sp. 97CO-5]PKG02251.1 hypothetical protein Y019_02795 [Alcanivorax sp. 97CO-6]